ncbi:hypothetical protein EV177_005221 [Coemansia sp. RSA 1804]|nr:hypothetical protein EV177_005221 [Coemansia sp. RSA 1804]
MASNDSGYYTNGSKNAEQHAFRRPTGKVVMVTANVNAPVYEYRPHPQQPQLYYPKERPTLLMQQQQQQQQQQMYSSADNPPHLSAYAKAETYNGNGSMHSAIPAPQNYERQSPPQSQLPNHPSRHPNQDYAPQQSGHYASIAPPNLRPSHTTGSFNPQYQDQQQQQQRFQQQQQNNRHQDGWQEQSYYQHLANDANRNTHSNDPTLLVDNFQQMSVNPGYSSSGTRTPVSEIPRHGTPTQHLKMSADTLRRREQKLEDDYDNDDGSASGDIDVSLFPSNPTQVNNLGRSERYGGMPTITSTNPMQNLPPNGVSSPLSTRTHPPGKHIPISPQTPPASSRTSTDTLNFIAVDAGTVAIVGNSPKPTCAAATSIDSVMRADTDIDADNIAVNVNDAVDVDVDVVSTAFPLHHRQQYRQQQQQHIQSTAVDRASNPCRHQRTLMPLTSPIGLRRTVAVADRDCHGDDDIPLGRSRTIYEPRSKPPTKIDNTFNRIQHPPILTSNLREAQKRHTQRVPLGLSRANTVFGSPCAADLQYPSCKGKHILRRRQVPSAIGKSSNRPMSGCSDDDQYEANLSGPVALQPLTPTPPHWRQCTSGRASTLHRKGGPRGTHTQYTKPHQHPPTNTSTTTTTKPSACEQSLPLPSPPFVARHQNMAPTNMRGPPVDFTAAPHGQAPVHGAYDNGFDPSDRPHLGVRPPTSLQRVGTPQGSRIGSASHGDNSGRFLAAASVYSHSGSGDALVGGHDPQQLPLQPYAGMRPWTASSRSLPLAAPPHNQQQSLMLSSERDAPSSSASSMVGVPPMAAGGAASPAQTGAPGSPKAPPPTAASLEAYRVSIKRSNDPEAQLEFAKYVLEHAQGIADQERNKKLSSKRYEILVAEGFRWVKKLAGGGITVHRTSTAAEAQFFLGTVYSRGTYGAERDDAKAFSYYQQASKSQHAEANYRTAVCYEVGVGIRRDSTRALQFYRKAAAQSNVPAMYKLGVILIKGLLGVAPSPREGITWLKRAAENATPECPHGLHELALCHETDDIPGVIQDLSYSRELYIKAGKLGYLPSQVRLGQAYESGKLDCPIDPRRSIGWYTRAAEKNDPEAEIALSGWYLTGAEPFLPQNDVEAYLWARRAADRGLAKAEYAVGYYYECGIGVNSPDLNEARKWYAKAAQKQNRRAIKRLNELKKMGVDDWMRSKGARPRHNKGDKLML